MSSAPARALELSLPDIVLNDLAATFPEAADALERRATLQGTLYYEIRDNVGLNGHQEVRWLKSNNQMINLNFIKDPGNGKCNDLSFRRRLRRNDGGGIVGHD